MTEICNICCEKLNLSTRKEIICVFCDYIVCRTCFQKYITEIPIEPHCMNCKKIFDFDFITNNCTSVFVTKNLKIHRENILFDREKALLPETQPHVVVELQKRDLIRQINSIEEQKYELRKQERILNNRILNLNTDIHHLNINNIGDITETPEDRKKFIRKCPMNECRGFLSTQWKCGSCERKICNKCNEEKVGDQEHRCIPENVASMELLNKDTKSCPNCGTMIFKISGCFAKDTPILLWNGETKMSQDIIIGDQLVGDDGTIRNVLDTTYGIDTLYQVNQSDGMSYTVNSKHTLLLKDNFKIIEIKAEDYINSTNLFGFKINGSFSTINILKVGFGNYYGFLLDSNHNFILKDFTVVQNCSQMFCVDCHTAWDWNTQRIVTGVVHNPHYYEFINRNGGAGRNHGDNAERLCGGLPDNRVIRNMLVHCYPTIPSPFLLNIHQCITHIQHYELRNHNIQNVIEINRGLRVKYLINELSEIEFKTTLQQSEKKRQKTIAFHNIYQMFIDVSSDIFRQIVVFYNTNHRNKEMCINFINENTLILTNLVEYFNENLKKIGKMYKCVYPGISKNTHWANNIETANRQNN